MNSVTQKVDKVITLAARKVVTKGGSFEQARQEAVRKLTARFPGLDKGVLLGGFDHRYIQASTRLLAS